MFEYQTLLEEPQYGENMEIYAGKKNNWVRVQQQKNTTVLEIP